MELTEAVLRILRHSRLIVAIVLVCLAIPLISSWTGDDTYVASARVSFGPDPVNEDEAEAMVDTVKAIVTTPGEVEIALGRHAASRDPARVEERVEVDSVGVSGVLTISVADRDPEVATTVANGLARRFLAARRDLGRDALEERLTEVDAQLASVSEDIREITRSGSAVDTIDARRLRLDAALSRQSALRAERERLNTTLDTTPTPSFLARATVPTDPEPSRLAADLAVAGLLGLILGVALTAVIEALRPTIVGRDALAAALGAPLLGRIPNPLPADADLSDNRVALPLTLAAGSAGVEVVHLTSVGPAFDLVPLAEQLGAGASELTVDTIGAGPATSSGPGARPRPDGQGLVVVAPEVQPRSGLSEVEHLLAISQWPLVGIITYPSSIWRRHPAPGPVRSRLRQIRAAWSSMTERHRRTPQHARVSTVSRLVPETLVRLRRLVRAPWGPDAES